MNNTVKFLKMILLMGLFSGYVAPFAAVEQQTLADAVGVIGRNRLADFSVHDQVVSADPDLYFQFDDLSPADKATMRGQMGAPALAAGIGTSSYELSYSFYVVGKTVGQALTFEIYIHGRWPGYHELYEANVSYDDLLTGGVQNVNLDANLELLLKSVRDKNFPQNNPACRFLKTIVSKPINVGRGGAVIEIKDGNVDDKYTYKYKNQAYEFLKHGSVDFWLPAECAFDEVGQYEVAKGFQPGDLDQEQRLTRMIDECFKSNAMNQEFALGQNPNKDVIIGHYAKIFTHLVRYMKNEEIMYNKFQPLIMAELAGKTCRNMVQDQDLGSLFIEQRQFTRNNAQMNGKNPSTACMAEYTGKQMIVNNIAFAERKAVRRTIV